MPLGTLLEYRKIVERRSYSALLFEGSVLQFSYDVGGDTVVGHRLAYVPCPFEIAPVDLTLDPILDVIDVYECHGREALRLRSPMRFDFDPARSREGHPASHLHIQTHDCRIPVGAALGVGHFVRFVFSRFYPRVWAEHPILHGLSLRLGSSTLSADEEAGMHITCGRRDSGAL
jgi:hypothetical protein